MKTIFNNSWQSAESAERIQQVFDNRFKEYGAYQIRTRYHRNVLLSMAATVLLLFIAVSTSTLFSKVSDVKEISPKPDVAVTNVTIMPADEELQPVEQASSTSKSQGEESAEGIPEIAEPWMDETLPGLPNSHYGLPGLKDALGNGYELTDQSRHFENNAAGMKDTTITSKFDRPGMFVGGDDAFVEFVKSNFDNGVCGDDNPLGMVTLRFLIDKSGKLSRITAIESTKSCPEFEKEAIRVLSVSPRWIPAMSKGKLVNAWNEVVIRMSED